MYFSFTDGSVLDVPDMCGYCRMSTGGAHESHCPSFQMKDEGMAKVKLEALPLFNEAVEEITERN